LKAIVRACPLLLAFGLSHAAADQSGTTLALFLPPVPPALGAEIPRPASPATSPPSDLAPLDLRPYIRDPFYVALSAQFAHREVGTDLAYNLETYLTTKSALQTELRAQLDLVRELNPAARETKLQQFAAEQTPRLAELENMAETLRRSIASRAAARRELIRWKIDSMAPSGDTSALPIAEARVFAVQTSMMVATFVEGLTTDQRRWLREVAEEYETPVRGDSTWAFLPAGSRLSLAPSDPVVPDLEQLLSEYAFSHDQLLANVRRVLARQDRFEPDAWIAVAPAQARLAAELENKAEAIRRLIVRFKDPAVLPSAPTVPAALEPKLARYRAAKTALQQQVLQRVEAAKQAGPAEAAPERIRQAIADFTTQHRTEYADLDQTRQQLLDQLSELAANSTAHPSSPDALMSNFDQSLAQLKSFWEYRDYENAILQPGLSPEQRRLLFDSALVKLDLPLPNAVRPIMEE